jgi:hypothetical protein
VDDKLKILMKELKPFLQLVVQSTLTTHVGVSIQQTHIQLSLVTNPILVSQHLSWLQLVTLVIARQPRTILYPTWYNTIPSFVPMDPNMYSMYYSRIKGLDSLIYGRKKGIQPMLLDQN